ncbi:MAG: PAS domain S-box protein [Candidatus Yonathbacteria bacterium]|nr:PAS domain S-box protein [Candidatus Yonathbacteria bacterium]
MKLRTKIILFFGTVLLIIALGISFYAEYVVGNVFKKQATTDLRIIAEQSESAYLSFLGSLNVRALDWTSDNTIRKMTKELLTLPAGAPHNARLAKEFATYVSEKKMPFDKTIFLTDLLNKDGIVIASTQIERIGKDEKMEEQTFHKVHNFDATINSKFGEVFFGTIVLGKDGHPEPTLNVTVRLFDIDENGEIKPLDAVLLVYYSNVIQIADVLGSGRTSVYVRLPAVTGRQTSEALLEGYQTSDLYLVNNDHIMVTPSRTIKDLKTKQKVDTLPVRECLENGKEISAEYDNYQGVRVLGSSMCFQREGTVLLVEVQKDELFAPLTALIRSTIIGEMLFFVLGIFIIFLFVRKPLMYIKDIVEAVRQVERGNLDTQIKVETNDELGYLATSFNTMISAVRDNQKHLREGNAKSEALLASLGEGMIAIDNTGSIITINRMAEKILGLKSVEVVGKKAIEVINTLDENGKEIPQEQRVFSLQEANARVISKTMLYRRKDDGYLPVAITVTPVILDEKIIGSINIFRDITEEKKTEKMRQDILSLSSHQLRTPLSGTKWLIETLKRGINGVLNEKQTEYIDEIYKINERMTGLVSDMLKVLRIESGMGSFKKEVISTQFLFDAIQTTMGPAARARQIKLHFTDKESIPLVTAPELIRNILESFISNAITYSHSGSEVFIDFGKEGDDIIFSVKDLGIGIPKGEQEPIFSRFYRASNAKIFNTKSSGLGLYIAQTLAEQLGAKVYFESKENKGSTFFVRGHFQNSVKDVQ